jgi:hypothetical protein
MELVQILMQKEAVHQTIHELAKLGCTQFRYGSPTSMRMSKRAHGLFAAKSDQVRHEFRAVCIQKKNVDDISGYMDSPPACRRCDM